MLDRSSVGGESTLKMRLVATEDYLDVNRLIGEIKTQHKDSYSLHCLLQKVKDHTDSLQQIEAALRVKENQIRLAFEKGRCTKCGESKSEESSSAKKGDQSGSEDVVNEESEEYRSTTEKGRNSNESQKPANSKKLN